ncbi:unnamed protein product [Symbiodinium sp. CCMP2592]|nr:unnamed protein product [Symbiodinium sp. CCMP2592]
MTEDRDSGLADLAYVGYRSPILRSGGVSSTGTCKRPAARGNKQAADLALIQGVLGEISGWDVSAKRARAMVVEVGLHFGVAMQNGRAESEGPGGRLRRDALPGSANPTNVVGWHGGTSCGVVSGRGARVCAGRLDAVGELASPPPPDGCNVVEECQDKHTAEQKTNRLGGREWQSRTVSTPGHWTHSRRSQTVLEEEPDASGGVAARATAAEPDSLDPGGPHALLGEGPDAGELWRRGDEGVKLHDVLVITARKS